MSTSVFLPEKNKFSPEGRPICNYCQKVGHMTRECFTRIRRGQNFTFNVGRPRYTKPNSNNFGGNFYPGIPQNFNPGNPQNFYSNTPPNYYSNTPSNFYSVASPNFNRGTGMRSPRNFNTQPRPTYNNRTNFYTGTSPNYRTNRGVGFRGDRGGYQNNQGFSNRANRGSQQSFVQPRVSGAIARNNTRTTDFYSNYPNAEAPSTN